MPDGAPVASVVPTAEASTTLRPLGSGAVRIEAGFWAERQRLNREVTIPAGWEQLERAGTLDNFRIAAGRAEGEFRGFRFADSDVYKWLEAVGWELGRAPSTELERLAREATELVAAAQEADGYLNTYCRLTDPSWRYTDLALGHELYCAGHLLQAAVAHARAGDGGALLAVARRFADELDATFGPGRRDGLDGHAEVEPALVELYRVTGERRYLELASVLVERRGHGHLNANPRGAVYSQDHEQVRASTSLAGHAVRALYLMCGVTDVAVETHDVELLDVAVRLWDDTAATKTYLTGGLGSRHEDESFGEAYELPPDTAYCETCAAIASVMWSWRLLLATGDARYADSIERTLYNGFLAGVSLDGRRFFYVNPLECRGGDERQEWFACACCPPNAMRLLASLDHYVATETDDGVQVHQYATGTIVAGVAGLRVETGYPWRGRVEVEVVATRPGPWTLSLRVPAWCEGARLAVNGEQVDAAPVRRVWSAGDRVVLDLPLAPRLTAPHPRVDAVRGCLAIERGPLVYCLEEADAPGADLADVVLDPDAPLGETERPDLLGGVVTVEAQATAVPYFAWANRGPGAMRVWIPAR